MMTTKKLMEYFHTTLFLINQYKIDALDSNNRRTTYFHFHVHVYHHTALVVVEIITFPAREYHKTHQ